MLPVTPRWPCSVLFWFDIPVASYAMDHYLFLEIISLLLSEQYIFLGVTFGFVFPLQSHPCLSGIQCPIKSRIELLLQALDVYSPWYVLNWILIVFSVSTVELSSLFNTAARMII